MGTWINLWEVGSVLYSYLLHLHTPLTQMVGSENLATFKVRKCAFIPKICLILFGRIHGQWQQDRKDYMDLKKTIVKLTQERDQAYEMVKKVRPPFDLLVLILRLRSAHKFYTGSSIRLLSGVTQLLHVQDEKQ